MKIEGKSVNLRKVTKVDAESVYENARDGEIKMPCVSLSKASYR